MQKLDQLSAVRKTLKAMLKAYIPFTGKNLNRFKTENLQPIENLRFLIENTPFEIQGLCSCIAIDHKKVCVVELENKIVEIENVIHELDLFQSSYLDQAVLLQQEISKLVSDLREIKINFKSMPSYYIDDIVKDKIKSLQL